MKDSEEWSSCEITEREWLNRATTISRNVRSAEAILMLLAHLKGMPIDEKSIEVSLDKERFQYRFTYYPEHLKYLFEWKSL